MALQNRTGCGHNKPTVGRQYQCKVFLLAELVVRSTGADCFIPVRSVDVSRCPLFIAFRSAPSKRPANHSSFNEALNLRSRGQQWPARSSLSWHGRGACASVHLPQIPELTRSKENAMTPSLLP